MNEQEKLLKKINELAHKAKDGTITKEEEDQQAELRKEFLKNFRESFRSQIEMTKVFDKNGKEVTPEKVREIQRKKGLRDD
ncbi:UPF0291 protein [Companilactobacillus crustorum]|uniref:UPF0291 protein FD26_GL001401 n=3 Tax=Companilactobacillus TaxID=2767879 RepID=A0A837RKS8_9LACO|nr:DUF896 domain-containing protein [Companilactobacillus crustorum]HCD07077.1 DUF896 family protein [Lactobacillus sp.]APU71194.1 UPF0291 protein [Companilactobacillus crustorum]KRK43917.1 hypothetical protein FD26_GL001401 [Companilactobacillus crustorum JCM 15951]KRO21356.1 hypothetical protein IV63_GL001490 [Companilactobacillus crustorum]WDT64570.1 DUF896 domain-containing protein [Companilactobacillus crustorum]